MKRYLLVAVAMFSCIALSASEPERVEMLSSKVILQNTNGYYVFSDGSCWKVMGFATRWRNLTEWWNSVQLAPQHYECVPSDWYLGSQIEIYPKYGNLEADEANASNEEDIRRCTHLLVNSGTGQVLFAVALDPGVCIAQLYTEAHEDGYKLGYDLGSKQRYNDVYNNGYSDGYKAGYGEGFQSGQKK